MKIYAGNLSYQVTEDDLQTAFEQYGQVDSVTIIKDRFSGESKGFAFIEMPSRDEANAAITGLNGQDIQGRAINVNEARPRPDRPQGGRGGRGGGGGGGGGFRGKGGRGGGGGGGRRY